MANSSIYRAIYIFSKEITKHRQNIMVAEYNRLRRIACDRINPLLKKWNEEYSGKKPDGDIYSETSREYNEYIRSKEETILDQVNSEVRTYFTEIHADEVGDLIGVNKKDPNLILRVEFEPV